MTDEIKQKILISFEYGLTLSESAKDMKIKLTPEIVKKCEDIISKEFAEETIENNAKNMIINILASLELKE